MQPQILSETRKQIEYWQTLTGLSPAELKELGRLMALDPASAGEDDLLKLESFVTPLKFGTGGLRGRLGLGAGRMNLYTVSKAAAAFCKVLRQRHPAQSKHNRFVIAGDSRLLSDTFIVCTAQQAHLAGFEVHVFSIPTPTPLLSFAIRQLEAAGGVVLTASHNPKDYNGFKAYLEDGGQIVSPIDKEVLDEIDNFQSLGELDLPTKTGHYPLSSDSFPCPVHIAGDEILKQYCSALETTLFAERAKQLSLDAKDFPIIYSPLHGTGGYYLPKVLNHFGFTGTQLVPEQAEPDGLFPTLTYPNPEEEAAMVLARALAEQKGAPLFCATDPDSDRLGIGVSDGDGGYTLLNGNQIGTIMAAYLIELAQKADDGKDYRVFKTVVTTDLQRRVAEDYNIPIRDVLTGFKYIAEEINAIQKAGDNSRYLFGGEESYGYLPVDFVHDKDSLSSALLIALIYADKRDLVAYLDSLYIRHGLFLEDLVSLTLEGQSGQAQIGRIIDKLSNPPKDLFTRKIKGQADINTGTINGAVPDSIASDLRRLPSSKVLQFFLEGGAKITIRPSGTEPKIKFYFSFCSDHKPNAQNLAKAKANLQTEIKENKEKLMEFCKDV